MFDISVLFLSGIISQCGATDDFLPTVMQKVNNYNPYPSGAGLGALTVCPLGLQ